MLIYILKRIVYTLPIMLGVTLVCFALVHLAPGDPLVSVLPPDASQAMKQQMMALYGFDRPYYEQFLRWLWRALHGDLGSSIASEPAGRRGGEQGGRQHADAGRGGDADRLCARHLLRLRRRLFPRHLDRQGRLASSRCIGVSVPHYWLGMVLVIIFAATLGWLPPTGAGPGGSGGLGLGLGAHAPPDPAGRDHVA